MVVRRGQALHDGGRDAGIGRLEGRGEPAFRGFLQQLLGAGGLNKFGALEPSVGFPHGGRRAQHRNPGQFIGVITCQVQAGGTSYGEPREEHGKLADLLPDLVDNVHDGRGNHVQGWFVLVIPDLAQRMAGVVDEHHQGVARQKLRHLRPLV